MTIEKKSFHFVEGAVAEIKHKNWGFSQSSVLYNVSAAILEVLHLFFMYILNAYILYIYIK